MIREPSFPENGINEARRIIDNFERVIFSHDLIYLHLE